jgi:hypothetical protein
MKTYRINDRDGKLLAFEFDYGYIRPRKIAKLLMSYEGTADVRSRRWFDGDDKNHLEFEFLGGIFVVSEPYGDKSRYWIGPKDPASRLPQIDDIEQLFKQYTPPLIVRFIVRHLGVLTVLSSFVVFGLPAADPRSLHEDSFSDAGLFVLAAVVLIGAGIIDFSRRSGSDKK